MYGNDLLAQVNKDVYEVMVDFDLKLNRWGDGFNDSDTNQVVKNPTPKKTVPGRIRALKLVMEE